MRKEGGREGGRGLTTTLLSLRARRGTSLGSPLTQSPTCLEIREVRVAAGMCSNMCFIGQCESPAQPSLGYIVTGCVLMRYMSH